MGIALNGAERSISMKTMTHRWRMAAAWGLVIAALLLLSGPVGSASGGERDICQRAMLNCLAQGFTHGSLLDQLGVLLRLEYCLAGFEFCRKYVSLYV